MNISSKSNLHSSLNPVIWDGFQLRDSLRENLLDIVEEFHDWMDLDVNFIDAQLVGSNASYNYTENSDLDLHIVVNFDSLEANSELIQAFFNAEKRLFNEQYDLTIKGIDVEIYVEDIKAGTLSNGIYSLFEDRWIKQPEPIQDSYDVKEVRSEVSSLMSEVDSAIVSRNSSEVQSMIDKLYMIRKNGLATDGEYSVGNQVFKEFRNTGKLDALKQRLLDLRSNELSIYSSKYEKEGDNMVKKFKITASEDRVTHAFQISFDVGCINGDQEKVNNNFIDKLEDTIYKFLQDYNMVLLGMSDGEDMDHGYSDKDVLEFLGEISK